MFIDSSKPLRPPVGGFNAAILSTVGVVVIFVATQFFSSLILLIYPVLSGWSQVRAQHWLQASIVAQFFFVLLAESLTVLAVLGLVKLLRWRLADIGLKKPKWYQPLWGIVAVVPYYLLLLAGTLIIQKLIPSFNVSQQQDIGFTAVHGAGQLALTFVSLVILPPLAEEITMRGFLYTGLRKWLPRLVSALIVSALFGAAHLAEGGAAGPLWVGALDTFILSMILVSLREITGNLWAGITLHALKNGIAFVSIYIVMGVK